MEALSSPGLVANGDEVEAPGRRRRASLAARAAFEQRRELLRRTLEHRADERAHHVAQERVGRDLELERVAAPVPAADSTVRTKTLVLRLGRREGAEVVLAER